MDRDLDPRCDDQDRPDVSRGGRVGDDTERVPPETDARDVFRRDVALPRGPERERVRGRDREYDLRGSESRLLTTVGAVRVATVPDLQEEGQSARAAERDVEHLRDSGLVDTFTAVVDGERTTVVTLSDEGRALLEASRVEGREGPTQTFHAGPATRRELQHDLKVLEAYRDAADRIHAGGGRVQRVVLERDLKREYQQFLQAPNRGRRGSSGRPQRDPTEIARWAEERGLPTHDGHVEFPDARVEYERPDGRHDVQDLEIVTPHYRGAHAAAKAASGFTAHQASGPRLTGRQQGGRGGRGVDPRLAEELIR
jgi:hypothetical protein